MLEYITEKMVMMHTVLNVHIIQPDAYNEIIIHEQYSLIEQSLV